MTGICFRVDASNKVGMGHLTESLSLAESLGKSTKVETSFITNDFLPAVEMVKERGYKVRTIRGGATSGEELALTLQLIRELEADFLICDLLGPDNEYFQKVKSYVKCLVVILDDEVYRVVAADLVVNFNITQGEAFYKNLPDTKTVYCICPRYMLLPEALHQEWKKEKHVPDTCKTIFVNQGGSDPFGLTAKIIRALEPLNLKQRVAVVVGPAISPDHKKELESLEAGLKNNYRFEWNVTQNRMYKIMSESDLAITAAGNALYELAIFGVPSIVICHHERHNAVAQRFAEKDAVINLGIGTTLETHAIGEAVNKLLQSRKKRLELSTNMKKIVDGLGSKRVAEKVLELCQKY